MTPILLAIFGCSILGMIVLLVRHWSALGHVDPGSHPALRQHILKEHLLLSRLRKRIGDTVGQFPSHVHSLPTKVTAAVTTMATALRARIAHYEHAALAVEATHEPNETKTEKLARLLADAQAFAGKERYEEAEQRYLAALALDATSIPAYEGLGNVYLDQKEYEQARATFRHIVRLNERHADAYARLGAIASATGNLVEAESDYTRALSISGDLVSAHLALGGVHRAMGDHAAALENLLRARELEPRNPHILDELLDTAIILQKKELARTLIKELAEVNPENQKIPELGARIGELPDEPSAPSPARRGKGEVNS